LKDPKKFIGHGLSVVRARELRAEGHALKKDAKGRFRRVVGSPRPLAIHELSTIRSLVEKDTVVIACGGGGIPVYRDPRLGLEGVDAVIDKDLAAAVLARELGAELLLILTDVDAVYTGWGTEQQRAISSMSVLEADRLAAEGAFGEGSMGPKVAAAVSYVRATKGRAIITELSRGQAAVKGSGGTEVTP
ncbi:MAG: carbamate kinase, partial [Gemmatimonadota bacterium]|nr:carbamate kinase [Gemmatimonadota bacterium]